MTAKVAVDVVIYTLSHITHAALLSAGTYDLCQTTKYHVYCLVCVCVCEMKNKGFYLKSL